MRSNSRGTAVLTGAAVLGMLVVLLLGGWWRVEGGRWFTVSTPSMGESLPVGTALFTMPTTVADSEPGDVITFRNPDTGVVFTHRVVGKDSTGLETRGDANNIADGWRITDDDLVGEVVGHAEGLGWLIRAVPPLALGGIVVWLATKRIRLSARRSWRILGFSVVVALVNWWLSPWVNLVRLAQAPPPDAGDGVMMEVMSTGLLPIRVIEIDGPAQAPLTNGAQEWIHLTAGVDRGAYDVAAVLDLSWWGWVALGLCVATPLLLTLAVGRPPSDMPPSENDGDDDCGEPLLPSLSPAPVGAA